MERDKIAAASSSTIPSLTYEYYPAYAHSAHSLHNTWFKLPATVIQTMHVPPGFESSITSSTGSALPLYHLLNHPVPFADVCGLVVGCSFKDNLGVWSILVDDGSGIVLEVLCRKAREEEEDFWRLGSNNGKARVAGPGELIVPPVPEWQGRGWIGAEAVDMRQVQVGKVLRIKGRPREWRATKQLLVERIFPIHNTAEEVHFWQSMCDTYEAVLSKPWRLPDKVLRRLQNETLGGGKKKRKKGPRRERTVERISEPAEKIQGVNGAQAETTSANVEKDVLERTLSLQDEVFNIAQQKHSQGSPVQIPIPNGDTGQANVDQGPSSAKPAHDATEITMAHDRDNHPSATRVDKLGQCTVTSTPSMDNEDALRGKALDDAQYPAILKRNSPTKWEDVHLEFSSSNAPPPGNQQAILKTNHSSSEGKEASQASNQRNHDVSAMPIVNKGSPSEWDTLDLRAGIAEQGTSEVLHDDEWLRMRNKIIDADPSLSYSPSSRSSDKKKIVDKGLPSEWDTLDIDASMAEQGISKVLYSADWLKVRNKMFSTNPDHVHGSPSTQSERKKIERNTERVQTSAPFQMEAPTKPLNLEDEWDRLVL